MIGFTGSSTQITVNYNSSYTELLLNGICLVNLSEESISAV
jgi:hypothetical protein